jgi:hypothetical protein
MFLPALSADTDVASEDRMSRQKLISEVAQRK